ncbi:MAG: hypothetical protein CMB80_21135 [Flammeovirgaceae bacterium]|nr:hypothetical protein [Flammeovirgaceae bacterium]MBE62841.1 hypothetical protein [Flammeovirgaceae bacterium]HCX20276.1 hypothetical protein [Cytophagales bacterium]
MNMQLFYLGISLLFLVLIMLKFRINAFMALLMSAFLIGVFNQMGLIPTLESITTGLGNTIGSLALIITFGAMLGKVMEVTGAAFKITDVIVQKLGKQNITYAVLLAGFIIGLPMMYNASFLVLIPIIYAFSHLTKIPLLQLGIPLSASLSVAHGYLPPHPAPVVVSQMYGADMNTVFIYGIIVAIPAIIVAGVILPKFFTKLDNKPPENLFQATDFDQNNSPSFIISLLCAIIPFILMASAAIFQTEEDSVLQFLGDPNIALFIAVLIAIYFLGVRRGISSKSLMSDLEKSIMSIAMILLIIGAGGSFKQVLSDSGSANYIKELAAGWSLNPIILGWLLAAVIRLILGSATVATITAAGIMAPIVQQGIVPMEIMVLATGSGSLMFSHFNDIGFWMFKEYYNVSIKQTFMIWTTMECLIGIIGLIGCLILNLFIG